MISQKYSNNTSFIDLLFNSLLLFFCLCVIAFALINKDKSDTNLKSKAEFVVTAEWTSEVNDDYDLYAEYDNSYICYFRKPESGPLSLERDDLGHVNDVIPTKFGQIKYEENIEHIYIRAAPKGWYIVNVHAYRKRSPEPITVKIKLEKLNPYSVIDYKELTFDRTGQEKTVLRFKLNEDKEVVKITREEKSFVGG